jgi:hypothetical protein
MGEVLYTKALFEVKKAMAELQRLSDVTEFCCEHARLERLARVFETAAEQIRHFQEVAEPCDECRQKGGKGPF